MAFHRLAAEAAPRVVRSRAVVDQPLRNQSKN